VFDLAVFTNFGRDRLDFHRDLDDYFAAKAGLFTPQRARRALLNVDDPAQRSLVERPRIPTRTFSPSGAEADWRCEDVTMAAEGARFTLAGPGLRAPVTIALPGEFNVANALCALAIVGEAGYDVKAASDGLAAVGSVPGRMETIDNDLGITVVVDYAHKPDAIKAVLATLRPVTPGRLIVVLGAGGDRDAGKRPIMGEYAAAMADIVVVTDDNPRSEDPARIRAEILAGVKGPGEARDLGDRRRAIHEAVAMAAPGDTVLIAGKGHETGQEVAGEVFAFDDREVARDALTACTAALGGQP
jgi:UDP-N-acetylmuramoyl-L-alanyl-D-glutamate--2,6-diaminopimelate ligase